VAAAEDGHAQLVQALHPEALRHAAEDFSLDPVAVRQVFTVSGTTRGRWTWLLQPGMASILGTIPVCNFPGWMLIKMYATICVLLGRWWFRRVDYKPAVGYLYPFAALVLAMITMVTPLPSFLLWLQPFFAKGAWPSGSCLSSNWPSPPFSRYSSGVGG
jgi:hypothetical protein